MARASTPARKQPKTLSGPTAPARTVAGLRRALNRENQPVGAAALLGETSRFTVDGHGRVVSINESAADFFHVDSARVIGRSIALLEFGLPLRAPGFWEGIYFALRIQRLFRFDYCYEPQNPTWLEVVCEPFDRVFNVSFRDISHRKEQEKRLFDRYAALLQERDDERQRLARELHATTTQDLVVVLLAIDRLREKIPPADHGAIEILEELRTTTVHALSDTKTLSERLYPPMLDEVGLVPALTVFLREFKAGRRCNITLNSEEEMPHFPQPVALVFFRIIEAVLPKIVRHRSHIARIQIRLGVDRRQAKLVILNVGGSVDAMRSFTELVSADPLWTRLHKLGGHAAILTIARGVQLSVSAPLDPA